MTFASVFAFFAFSCPGNDVSNNGEHHTEGDYAYLESITVAGKTVMPGKPATGLSAAEKALLIISFAQASAGCSIDIIADTDDAVVVFGKMAPGDSVPAWRSSGELTFANGEVLVIRVTAVSGKILYYAVLVFVEILDSLFVAGESAVQGYPAESYSAITNPGSASISGLTAGSAGIELTFAQAATFRTAKTSGDNVAGEPQWSNSASPVYSFSDGDFLFLEISPDNENTVHVYKIIVTVTEVTGTVRVSGIYTLNINSTIPQQRVVIEVYSSQTAGELISRTEADLSNKTWSMQVMSGQELWFKVAVTDTTGFSFGKIVSANGRIFTADTAGINLTLGPYAPPEITAFTLIGAQYTATVSENKPGTINHNLGTITFANTSFTSLMISTIIPFHNLAANFTLPEGVKLYAGNIEQVSGVTANNYYKDVVFTVIAEDNARRNYTIAGQVLNITSSASGASNATSVNRVAGTSSWQTQGFGIMIVDTVDKTTGLPEGTVNKLNFSGVWNPTGTFTYIGPTGRVISGGTDIRARGNYTLRHNRYKGYNLRLNTAAGFDYYDYKKQEYIQLPAHRRWALLAHQDDPTRIRTPLAWEMGRRVLTDMGWQPHADWVFYFLNGRYMGMYILVESIKPETGRQGITPLISASNPNGGFSVEMNNFYFYFDEGGSNFTFDELYNFMSSHQNPVNNRQQGVLWSMNDPDSNLGWYYPDPPVRPRDVTLTFTNPDHAHYYPRNAIILQATLGSGTAYNRRSGSSSEWRVPNEIGQSNGIGTPGMLLTGSLNQNNGGIFSTRTLSQVYPNYASSTFVRIAQILQDAEDAVYSHDWNTRGYGKGSYLDHIDINSFIDFHIATEMISDWEIIILNGRYAHYCPQAKKLKMGPLWDFDNLWNRGARGANPGFVRQTPFWYKELLGWQITSSNQGVNLDSGQERPGVKDPYYADRLKSRWNSVKDRLGPELNPYIQAQNARFSRVTGFNNSNLGSSPVGGPFSITGSGYNDRLTLINTISDMRTRLDTVFNGY